jgi:hypothetical protein
MSLKNYIIAQYGVGLHATLALLKHQRLKLSSAKNCSIFLKRCLTHQIVPKFLQNKCPLKSKRAKTLTSKYQKELLKDYLYTTKKDFFSLFKKIKDTEIHLKDNISQDDSKMFISVIEKSYENSFCKHKHKLKTKI